MATDAWAECGGELSLEVTMAHVADRPEAPAAIRTDLGAIFISLELSRSTWSVASPSPGSGEKMSKHTVRGGDIAGLLARFADLGAKARARMGRPLPLVVMQEAGLDGFWIHRVPVRDGIEPCRRPRLNRHRPSAPTGEDRPDRRRGAGAGAARPPTGRAPGVRPGQGADGRGGPSSPLPRARR
jgi:hypothetical protein